MPADPIVDPRPRITQTGKPVNLAQLALEAGAPLAAGTTDVVVCDSSISAAQLQTAYDAHVADPNFGKPAEDANLAGLRAKAQAVFAGTDSFTAAQLQKIVAGLVLRATR